jgi:hypothetical protein
MDKRRKWLNAKERMKMNVSFKLDVPNHREAEELLYSTRILGTLPS